MSNFLGEIRRFSRLKQWSAPVLVEGQYFHLFRPEGMFASELWQGQEEQLLAGDPGELVAQVNSTLASLPNQRAVGLLASEHRVLICLRNTADERLSVMNMAGEIIAAALSPLAPPALSSAGELVLLLPPARGERLRYTEVCVDGTLQSCLVRMSGGETTIIEAEVDATGQLRARTQEPLLVSKNGEKIWLAGEKTFRVSGGSLLDLAGFSYPVPDGKILAVSAPCASNSHIFIAVRQCDETGPSTRILALFPGRNPQLITELPTGVKLRGFSADESGRLWLTLAEASRGSYLASVDSESLELQSQRADTEGEIIYEQHTVRSEDGQSIPYILAFSPEHRRDNSPLLLTVYGGFGIENAPDAEPTLPAWAKAGGIMVFAQVRGGSEKGEAWHRAGQGASKMRTINDVLTVAQAVREHSRGRLTICGASFGGLTALISALEADARGCTLFDGIVATSPLLEALHLDRHPNGAFWGSELPADEAARADLSPLHRLRNFNGDTLPPLWLASTGQDARLADNAPEFAELWSAFGQVQHWRDEDLGHVGAPLKRIDARAASLLQFAAAGR